MNAVHRRFDAVFFDLGYTLLDLVPFEEWMAGFCADHAVALSSGELVRYHAGIPQEIAAFQEEAGIAFYAAPLETTRSFWLSLFRRLLDASCRAYPSSLPDTLYEHFTEGDGVRVYPDVVSTLTALRNGGVRVAAISDWEAWCEPMLRRLGVSSLLDFALISGAAGIGKPDARLYRMALEQAGVAAERAVHVGDDPQLDCEAALAVGITPVLLDRHGRYSTSPWIRCRDLTEFCRWLSG